MSTTRIGVDEEPLFFASGSETLFGIRSAPAPTHAGAASATDGLVVLGGGKTPSTVTGRNAIFARLARAGAQQGMHAIRFDYHGVGDSTGSAHQRLDRPAVDDLVGAGAVLRSFGAERLFLVGSCYGGRTALSGAAAVGDVAGILMLSPPLRDFASSERVTKDWSAMDHLKAIVRPRTLIGGTEPITPRRYLRFLATGARVALRRVSDSTRRGGDPTPWVSPAFLEPLAEAIAAAIPITIVYGEEDGDLVDFRDAHAGRLGELLGRAGSRVEVVVLPGRVHGFATLDMQDVVARVMVERLRVWRS